VQEEFVSDGFCRGELFTQNPGQPWGQICAQHRFSGGDLYDLVFNVGWNLSRALTLTLDTAGVHGNFAGNVSATAIGTTVYTVATLPSSTALAPGSQVVVNDAASFTPGPCTGGGSNYMIAVWDGTATWSCH
jgi:hypothetical protein